MEPGFEVVGLAALGAAASEFISWLLIYRKQEYQRLSASIANAVRLRPACTVPRTQRHDAGALKPCSTPVAHWHAAHLPCY